MSHTQRNFMITIRSQYTWTLQKIQYGGRFNFDFKANFIFPIDWCNICGHGADIFHQKTFFWHKEIIWLGTQLKSRFANSRWTFKKCFEKEISWIPFVFWWFFLRAAKFSQGRLGRCPPLIFFVLTYYNIIFHNQTNWSNVLTIRDEKYDFVNLIKKIFRGQSTPQ